MTDWLPGTSTAPRSSRWLFLLLLTLMPLWVGATGSLARLVLYLGCLILLFLVSVRSERLYRPPGLLPLALFCLWLLLQTLPLPPAALELFIPGYTPLLKQGLWLVAPGHWHPLSVSPAATFDEFLRYAAYLAFYVAATNLLISSQGQKRLLSGLSVFFGLYAFFGLVQFFSPTERIFWFFAEWPKAGRFFATYVNGNHYAGLLGMVFPLLVVCLLLDAPQAGYGRLRERMIDIFTDRELNRTILLGLVTVIAAVSVFFSLSRSGTFTLFASSLLLLLLLVGREKLRGRMLLFLSLLVAAVGLLAFFGWDPLLERFARTFNAAGELQTQRFTYWVDSINLVRSAPLTGSGAGTFIDVYPIWQSALTHGLVVDHAHNDYVELLTDTGLIGVSLILWFWVSFLRQVIPAWRQRRNRIPRLIAAGSFTGLSAILLHSFTDFNLEIPANGLYLFLLCALLAAASHSTSRQGRRTLLPVVEPVQKDRLVKLCLLMLLAGLLLSGGTELARLRFVPVANLDMHTTDARQLKQISVAAVTASKLAPLQPAYSFAAGLVQGQQGNLDESLNYDRQAIWARPFQVEYQLQAARTLFALKQTDQAEKLLLNALKLNPLSWITRRELANFYLAAGREARGMETLKKGLELNPEKTVEVFRDLILAGIKRSRFFEVIPGRSRSWAKLGDFLRQLDDFEQADRAYRHGIIALAFENPPDMFIVWRYLDLLQNQKRNAEALELLRTALHYFPQNQYLLARLGVLYEREGLRDRAIESYRASILVDPRHDWVRKRLQALEKRGAN